MIPRIFVAANTWKSGWSNTTTRLPWVAIAPMPLTTNDIASVPISGVDPEPGDDDAVREPDRQPDGDAAQRSPTAGPNETASCAAVAPARP